MNSVSVQVVGGLGNQLFGLSAGLWASEVLGLGLIVDNSFLGQSVAPNDGNTPRSFELEKLVLPRAGDGTPIRVETLTYRAQRRGEPRIIRALSRLGIRHRDYWGKPWAVDDRVLKFAASSLLRGNFHTFGYFECLRAINCDFSLEVKASSSWAVEHVSRAIESKAIAVHLRLDDYVSVLPDLIPKDSYYNEAIRSLPSDFGSSPVWIFTDDQPRATQVIRRLDWSDRTIEWIQTPVNVGPAEVMEVMSNCRAIVASCSSFSIWASQFARPETQVIVPASALRLFGTEGISSSWVSI